MISTAVAAGSAVARAVTAPEFQVVAVQVAAFTEPAEISTVRFVDRFLKQVSGRFDQEPRDLGDGLPPEIPRFVLQSRAGDWRCQVGRTRVDVFWNRQDGTAGVGAEMLVEAAGVVLAYAETMEPRVDRLAAVVTRAAAHESPSLMLARHFCSPEWDRQPFDRPASFEVHALKQYALGEFAVNSWVRCKSGTLTIDGKSKPIVLVEQDLNTRLDASRDASPPSSFDRDAMDRFWRACPPESDTILGLYFPSRKP